MDLEEFIREFEKLIDDPEQKLTIKPRYWLFPGPWTEEEVRQAQMIADQARRKHDG